MKMKMLKVMILSTLLLTATGCWDQKLLKENTLAFSISYDTTDKENQILGTSIIRILKQIGGGQTQPINIIVESKGRTPREIRKKWDTAVPGIYAPNKVQVILFGEELAKKGIYSILDIFYRDQTNNINAKPIITKGKASSILKMKEIKHVLISQGLSALLHSTEERSITPEESLATIFPVIFDPGTDLFLPYFEKTNKETVEVKGVALFHGDKFTGHVLTDKQATILLLLTKKEGKYTRFTFPMGNKEHEKYLSISVFNSKQKTKLKINNKNQIKADISLKLNVTINEYINGRMDEKDKLNELLSEKLTLLAKSVTNELQAANCDALAIRREIMIKHPELSEKYNQKKQYQEIEINPKVTVNILNTGVLN
ncbi:Ger(x)C family spore germination protein [Neobacillus massiliamazoniensis]|uniref:Spore germination protein GerKC n=1 Tax=Neobacillus massiliamazoniensis TaxID=1499688 RepID=A0A0U1NT54_9BACI|nr:Ger(x)C family spore germination protein [Neobacillus massiliamazoniensis]CRK81224.1 spore germination protein GerKC [Neobacillus massiliamazoniensis]